MRRAFFALTLTLAVVVGCGPSELTIPKPPAPEPQPKDIPEIPRSFLQELITHRKVDGLKIRIYNTGSVVTHGSYVSSIKSFWSKFHLDVPVFLLHHPKKGLILFDTGLHPDMETDPGRKMGRLNHFFVPFEAKPGQNAASQMRADGVDPASVRWVILSHLHLDHAGLMEGFPGAEVLVDKREWLAQKAKQTLKHDEHEIDPAAIENRIKLRLIDLSAAPAYGAFDHGIDLFGDGTIFLVDLAGHTAGNMGAWVSLDEGPVLMAGDASWILDNHQDLALPLKFHIYDLNQYWRRLYEMRAMQEAMPRLVIFPGHDLAPLKLQPRGDVTLAPFPR